MRPKSLLLRAGVVLALGLLLVSAGSAQGAVLLSHVNRAAQEFRVPPVALYALWETECSLRSTCVAGDRGESHGPFQIKAIRAGDHGCDGDWRQGLDNARCAARIIRDELEQTGSLLGAFTRYRCPVCWWRYNARPTTHGLFVYHKMLRLQLGSLPR